MDDLADGLRNNHGTLLGLDLSYNKLGNAGVHKLTAALDDDRNASDGTQQRLRATTDVPYLTDFSLVSNVSNLALYLDAELRPEGRSGPLARSLDAYAEYYRRWSLSWEAQALLRARGVAGSVKLIRAFLELADEVRYPVSADQNGLREIRRIKARVENERLPQGADPARHLKLGPGSISDVEWLVQILQLQHARAIPAMRTTSTLGALQAAVEAGLVDPDAAKKLAASWHLASRLRSANTLLSGQTSDVLPADRARLDGIGRILENPPHSATQVEEDYLGATRRARRVFEKLFYG
jgi:glutamate-ammonia-ligase adenylyltransferase